MDLMIKVSEDESVSLDELLHAQAHVLNHTFRFISSYSLKFAVQLEIPDILYNHGKPMIISDLASALRIHPSKLHSLTRLMRILVHFGIFTEDESKGYVLNLASRLLLKDDPSSIRPHLLTNLEPIIMKPLGYVGAWFRNEDEDASTPFNIAHGMSVWDCLGNEPKLSHMFNESMAGDSQVVAKAMLKKCKGVFEGLKSLVDVGGGTGIMTNALAKAFPNMNCIVFDLPHVVDGLQGSGNVKFVGGNMFHQVPAANAVMMKCILHSWSDEDCIKILNVCKEAMKGHEDKGVNSKIIIIEMVVESKGDDEQYEETKLFNDMLMMVGPSGRERNEQEWSKLFVDAGFKDYKIHHVLGLRSLIELFP